jgi:hypothetical protein
VLEKELRLIENMKINGMKMSNYWIVSYTFNFVFYMTTALLFLIVGTKVYDIQMFTETSKTFFVVVMIGWGLA